MYPLNWPGSCPAFGVRAFRALSPLCGLPPLDPVQRVHGLVACAKFIEHRDRWFFVSDGLGEWLLNSRRHLFFKWCLFTRLFFEVFLLRDRFDDLVGDDRDGVGCAGENYDLGEGELPAAAFFF